MEVPATCRLYIYIYTWQFRSIHTASNSLPPGETEKKYAQLPLRTYRNHTTQPATSAVSVLNSGSELFKEQSTSHCFSFRYWRSITALCGWMYVSIRNPTTPTASPPPPESPSSHPDIRTLFFFKPNTLKSLTSPSNNEILSAFTTTIRLHGYATVQHSQYTDK